MSGSDSHYRNLPPWESVHGDVRGLKLQVAFPTISTASCRLDAELSSS